MGTFVMIAAAVAMIVGVMKMKQGVEWGKPLAVACAVIALICALGRSGCSSQSARGKELLKAEVEFREACGGQLARQISEKHPSAKVLILRSFQLNPETVNKMEDAIVTGFRDEADGLTIVAEASPELSEKDMEKLREAMEPLLPESTTTPGEITMQDIEMLGLPFLEEWYTSEVLVDLLKKHPECDVVVAVSMLPMDFDKAKFWKDDHPRFGLALVGIGEFRELFRDDAIVAAVVPKPGADYKVKPKGNVDDDFGVRYLMVTPENAAALAKEHKYLFRE